MPDLDSLIRSIVWPDPEPALVARRRLDSLTKPPGSLGQLEDLVVRLVTITGSARPKVDRRLIFTLAADHGVATCGVSAYPQAVTAQMVGNFLRGGAAVNVLARYARARVVVADFGVTADLGERPGLARCRIGPGSKDMSSGPAMTRSEAQHAIEAGAGLVLGELENGAADVVGTGEMGIGNTTAASAILSALGGYPVERVTGRGTGLDDGGLHRKLAVIRRALETNCPDPNDPLDVLSKVGGFEIAGLVGVILAGASRRLPVVLDGFIAGAAALVAVRLSPQVGEYLIASHRSAEPGHKLLLGDLGLAPVFNLGMRLGEGTGAALAMPVLEAALRIYEEMATFEEAGVSGREGSA
jgi:nicotinate-nucleotide--dimethylbenzimidazole phosphoribosyltransferase